MELETNNYEENLPSHSSKKQDELDEEWKRHVVLAFKEYVTWNNVFFLLKPKTER